MKLHITTNLMAALALAFVVGTTNGYAEGEAACATKCTDKMDSCKSGECEAFKKLDADGNGSISLDEFKACPHNKGEEASKVEAKFKAADMNGNGSICKKEFGAMMAKSCTPDAVIKMLDKDGNGSLSMTEFKASPCQKGLSDEKVAENFKKLDADGSGSASKEEIAAMMKNCCGKEKCSSDKK